MRSLPLNSISSGSALTVWYRLANTVWNSVPGLLDENAELLAATGAGGAAGAWLGGTDAGAEGTWLTVFGDPLPLANWYPGEPNDLKGQDCLHFYDESAFDDQQCVVAFTSICECEP